MSLAEAYTYMLGQEGERLKKIGCVISAIGSVTKAGNKFVSIDDIYEKVCRNYPMPKDDLQGFLDLIFGNLGVLTTRWFPNDDNMYYVLEWEYDDEVDNKLRSRNGNL